MRGACVVFGARFRRPFCVHGWRSFVPLVVRCRLADVYAMRKLSALFLTLFPYRIRIYGNADASAQQTARYKMMRTLITLFIHSFPLYLFTILFKNNALLCIAYYLLNIRCIYKSYIKAGYIVIVRKKIKSMRMAMLFMYLYIC